MGLLRRTGGFLLGVGMLGSICILPGDRVAEAQALPGGESQPQADEQQAASEYTIGVYLLENGDATGAIPHLESAWFKSSHDKTIGERLAEAYSIVGELEKCEQVLDRLIASDGTHYSSLLLKAKIQYWRDDRKAAVQILEQMSTAGGRTFEVHRLLGRIYVELGRGEDALRAYGEALRLDPDYPVIQYRYGVLLKEFDRRSEAEESFSTAIRLEPRFIEAYLELAELKMEDGRHDEAEALLTKALARESESTEALVLLSELYADRGDLDKAIRLLEDRSKKAELGREAMILLGRLCYEAGDYDEALDIFGAMFDPEQDSAELARILGEIALRAGKPKKALEYYRQAIAIAPGDYRSYMALFFASSPVFSVDDSPHIDLKDGDIMQLLASAAETVEEQDFDGNYVIGISYQSVDSLEIALKFLQRSRDLKPTDERLLINLASVLEKLNRYEEAESHLVKLHELKPEDPTVCNFYGYLLALMGKDLKRAEVLVRTALKNDPNNGYYIDSLAWVYYMRGEYNRAAAELEKASGIVENDPVILEHLGDTYQSLRRYEDAIAAYEKSIELHDDKSKILKKIDAARERLE
jgi:tetratricopeptide (TPR) repeat protein